MKKKYLLLGIFVFVVSAVLTILFLKKNCVIRSGFQRANTPFFLRPFCREEYESLLNETTIVVVLKSGASAKDFKSRHAAAIQEMKGPYEGNEYQIYLNSGYDYATVVKNIREDPAVASTRPVFLPQLK